MSCIVLVLGIYRMVRICGSIPDMLPNKFIMIIHILAYFIIIVFNAFQYMIYNLGMKAYEIYSICDLVAYFLSNLIFGLILNTIVAKIETKIEMKTKFESTSSTIINSETGSFLD